MVKCLWLAYTFRESGGVGPLGQAQRVECGSGLEKPLFNTAESKQKAEWQLCIAALPSDGPSGSRPHERDYDQLWPLRTAVPFVTTFSIFGLFALMNKFVLYQSIYYRITLAGSTASQRSTLYFYLGARATSSVVSKRRIVYRYWILPAHQALC